MNPIQNIFSKINGNFSTKCNFCRISIKKKDAHIEIIKQLEFVYPRPTAFCSKSCCEKYVYYEQNCQKSRSMCPMCPTHPDA